MIDDGDVLVLEDSSRFDYYRTGSPEMLLDGLIGTALKLGEGRNGNADIRPEEYVFTVNPRGGAVVVEGMQFTSGNSGNLDPAWFILEGRTCCASEDYIIVGQGPIASFESRFQSTFVISFTNADPHEEFRLTLGLLADTAQIILGDFSVTFQK